MFSYFSANIIIQNQQKIISLLEDIAGHFKSDLHPSGTNPPSAHYQPPSSHAPTRPPSAHYQPPSAHAPTRPPSAHYQPSSHAPTQPPSAHYQPPSSHAPTRPPSAHYQPPSAHAPTRPPSAHYQPPSVHAPAQPPSAHYHPPSAHYQSPSASYQPPSASYQPPSASYQPPSAHAVTHPPSASYLYPGPSSDNHLPMINYSAPALDPAKTNLDDAIDEIMSDNSFWEGLTTDDDACIIPSVQQPSPALSSPLFNPYPPTPSLPPSPPPLPPSLPLGPPPLPPPFATPPKHRPVEDVLRENTGTSSSSLRNLTMNLAKHCIFGKQELARCSLSGRNGTATLNETKLNYIKALVRCRVPRMSDIEFELTWEHCRGSVSKLCQNLRNKGRKDKAK